MQFIEANRHAAHQLEVLAARAPPDLAGLFVIIAMKRRELAAQAYAVMEDEEARRRSREAPATLPRSSSPRRR